MIPSFEDLCLMLFVTIDDHYRARPPPSSRAASR